MSFTLTFFHAPDVATPDAAARWLEQAPAQLPEPSTRFADFVAEVTQFYPDLSDDDDDTNGRNLWPEGLTGGAARASSVNVAVNLDMLDPGVMTVVAQSAARAGLSVLDEQNGLLYLPSYRVVGLRDATPRELPPISDAARQLMTHTIRGMRLREAQMLIADAVRATLGRGAERREPHDRTVVWRQHGELRQMLWFYAMRSNDKVNARLFVHLAFASDRLTALYLPLLPPAFEARQRKYDRFDGGAASQVRAFLPSLTQGDPHAGRLLYSHSDMVFKDVAERDALVAAARDWSRQVLRPYLDGLDSVEALRAWTLNDDRLRHCGVGRMDFPEYAAVLTLARLDSVGTLDAYAAAYRKSGGIRKLTTLFKEPSDQHFEQLVDGLRGLAV
jgi:hypothetical protein